jgi:hypothetical protein
MTNPTGWRKSSRSGNGGNCVEAKVTWQKSNHTAA